MLSIGLWRWYINMIITIMDIIHRPVFYLDIISTLYICPYITGNTLRLRYKPNRSVLPICLWRGYINITVIILDIFNRSVFYLIVYCYEIAMSCTPIDTERVWSNLSARHWPSFLCRYFNSVTIHLELEMSAVIHRMITLNNLISFDIRRRNS
jgi:hypothetical protein